jgi:voltage-gated potassium channel
MNFKEILNKALPNYKYFKELYLALLVIVGITMMGCMGYIILEGYTVIEAIYMTIITVSTVGFTEVQPLSEAGRLFTVILIFLSFGTFAYAVTSLSKYLIDGSYNKYIKQFRMEKIIDEMNGHIVVCGAGNNGDEVIRILKSHHKEIVLIEKNENLIEELRERDIHHVMGDATDESVLLKAGISRASSMITTLPKDTDNVFVVLTAREYNPTMRIVSRCSVHTSESKLKIAGANNVILPDKVGGARMASCIVNENINHFLDQISLGDKSETFLIEVLEENLPAKIKGANIEQLLAFLDEDCKVIGISLFDGTYVVNPSNDHDIPKGSELFFFGNTAQVKSIRKKLKIVN